MLNNLPPKVDIKSFGSDEELLLAAYSIFRNDFVQNHPYFRSKPISLLQGQDSFHRENTFWHIIGGEYAVKTHFFSHSRIEYLPWIAPIITNSNVFPNEILLYENERGKNKRTILWYKAGNYLIILSHRGGKIIIWTAYPIENPHTLRKVERDYEVYTKARGTP